MYVSTNGMLLCYPTPVPCPSTILYSCDIYKSLVFPMLTSHVYSLIEFFKKMKKWLEMARLPLSFQQKIEALERKFEVASIIYDKYRKVFRELFEMGEEKTSSAPTRPRGRKPNQ